jgi:hypothetical protein
VRGTAGAILRVLRTCHDVMPTVCIFQVRPGASEIRGYLANVHQIANARGLFYFSIPIFLVELSSERIMDMRCFHYVTGTSLGRFPIFLVELSSEITINMRCCHSVIGISLG